MIVEAHWKWIVMIILFSNTIDFHDIFNWNKDVLDKPMGEFPDVETIDTLA